MRNPGDLIKNPTHIYATRVALAARVHVNDGRCVLPNFFDDNGGIFWDWHDPAIVLSEIECGTFLLTPNAIGWLITPSLRQEIKSVI